MNDSDSRRAPWFAYAAAAWALVFMLFHISWAVGWDVGLDPEEYRKAFARPWFLAYDLIVVGLCALGVVVGLILARQCGQRIPRRVVGPLAWGGAAVLLLRSVASIAHVAYTALKGESVLHPMVLWELWFYLGAALFTMATFRFFYPTSD